MGYVIMCLDKKFVTDPALREDDLYTNDLRKALRYPSKVQAQKNCASSETAVMVETLLRPMWN
jgi:hypothetical protein